MNKVRVSKIASIVLLFCLAAATASFAQTFTSLASFDGTNGANPQSMSLVQGTDGFLYGTTAAGGVSSACEGGCGTVFKISGATLSTVYSFCVRANCSDGATPYASLVLGTDGNLYGTTQNGGGSSSCPGGCGTVFKISNGSLSTLHKFCRKSGCSDGSYPLGALVQSTNGDFYGTTFEGGASNHGTIFKITSKGKLTTVYSFCSQASCADGMNPWAGLIRATNGNFYGTTFDGGANGTGTVFEITPAAKLTTLHTFCVTTCDDGSYLEAGLVQGSDGNFYGVASEGGANGQGTAFKITAAGSLTTLYAFCAQAMCADGAIPNGPLVQATDGNFYGTALEGGNNTHRGTIFKLTAAGNLTTLYNFCTQNNCADGENPAGGLVQDTDGNFYGATYSGGPAGDGTVFSLSTGLGPFVTFVNPRGIEGATAEILGQGFTGTTRVTFKGTSAQFNIVSDTYITATVPSGAETGTVQVATPGGVLNSNAAFRVTPQILSFSPTSGQVGTPVTISGTGLEQTTKVTFGGVKATHLTVNSDTQVTADVPTGAKTGKIAITTKGGTATSTGVFTVTQ